MITAVFAVTLFLTVIMCKNLVLGRELVRPVTQPLVHHVLVNELKDLTAGRDSGRVAIVFVGRKPVWRETRSVLLWLNWKCDHFKTICLESVLWCAEQNKSVILMDLFLVF